MTRLTPRLLLGAYASGVFPMAESRQDRHLFWVDPEQRGILPLDAFHIPRRLRRTLRQARFEIRCDHAFDAVLEGCAAASHRRPDTWINREIATLYAGLFRLGCAHSIECWRNGRLAGGLYGVSLGAAFFGESMFSQETDASKVALCHLVARLRHGGYQLLDTQFVTDHLRQFGVLEIPRRHYRTLLARAIRQKAHFPPKLPPPAWTTFLAGCPG